MSSTTSTEEEDVLPDSTVSESGRSESEDIVSTQEEEREEKEDAEEKKDPPRDEAPHAESEEMNSLASTVSSSQDSQDSSDGTIHALLPKVNCPEKIVVCLDMGKEMTSRHVSSRDGSQFSPLSLAKRVIEIFVKTKSRMDRRHQFALMVLHDTPTLVTPFTHDPDVFCEDLRAQEETMECQMTFNVAQLLQEIVQLVPLPEIEEVEIIPPPYVVRVLLLYGRSHCVPSAPEDSQQMLSELLLSPHLFLDALYVHEPPAEDNKSIEIFNAICDLDRKCLSYVYEVATNVTMFHNHMAKLLAHPLQRPTQSDTYYKLQSSEDVS
ncbi:BRISC and BRCA1-A complex member 1-like [Branchiostoma floridae]|uniref:BRISC and BRCA1-A complex member 1 n=1 Tax=Branchiostoma floridae TaxID=7739 RepID=A0A9J7ME14_BRAFL|nr:BRISC and BRCA1-A complex member 1-like [Branchiostoma floridae]